MIKLHLALVNIAKRLAPMDNLILVNFVNNLKRINPVADASNGFVWQLQDEYKDFGAKVFKDDTLLINMSVWKNLESLYNYTYNSNHIEVFKRKKEWFSKMKMIHMAFWYIPEGYEPTFQDAKDRLDYLIAHGETPYAFGFKNRFNALGSKNHKPLF